tara:strand:+ start:3060 stop:3245 length:186 start_codon:yes stop_codon:yes gene_type:complete
MAIKTKSWEFFYCSAEAPYREICINTMDCKSPKRTASYKYLLSILDDDKIASIGYQLTNPQ